MNRNYTDTVMHISIQMKSNQFNFGLCIIYVLIINELHANELSMRHSNTHWRRPIMERRTYRCSKNDVMYGYRLVVWNAFLNFLTNFSNISFAG